MVGALGGIATTMVLGARAIARGLVSDTGVVTSSPAFEAAELVSLDDLVFGGHDVRKSDYWESAYQVYKLSGSLDLEVIQQLRPELEQISKQLRVGTAVNCGDAIAELVTEDEARSPSSLREKIARIRADIGAFAESNDLDRVVVVNLASTEPDLEPGSEADSVQALEALLDQNATERVRPSLLYSYAAFKQGCGFINFTPSSAALGGAMSEIGRAAGVPFMGNDGKTGETLVKSALAPMFKYRHLRVLSWQGYNILGDRDGQILSHSDNLASKVRTKDAVLQGILGYPLHTHVGIDYVESLDDRKTAWDFIHFQGFLDHKMSMQFTWQGCDAILAAPLVLDMVRLTDLAMRRGESGPMEHLSCYFKSPVGVDQHDLHGQFNAMLAYLKQLGVEREA
ncbi:MAG: myo-inositol-1-phosphate synthase [Planctomycetota bacterium]|nr:MAG: myo-inositol-1-phosphate synthase [Planctomycetota bacterium]